MQYAGVARNNCSQITADAARLERTARLGERLDGILVVAALCKQHTGVVEVADQVLFVSGSV